MLFFIIIVIIVATHSFKCTCKIKEIYFKHQSKNIMYRNIKISTVQHWLLPSPCLQRWRCFLHLTYQKRFCCACWSIPMSSRSWYTMRRTGTRAVTTSSTGIRRWIISSSFYRCVASSHRLTYTPHLYQQMWRPLNSRVWCNWLYLFAKINELKRNMTSNSL